MIVFKGQISIGYGPEGRNNTHVSQPPVDTKFPRPPPAPLKIQLDQTISTNLKKGEKKKGVKFHNIEAVTQVQFLDEKHPGETFWPSIVSALAKSRLIKKNKKQKKRNKNKSAKKHLLFNPSQDSYEFLEQQR